LKDNLSELNLKYQYRSSDDDIVNEFYIPTLKRAVEYRRAVGFFTSNALMEISKGVKGLINNGGKIYLIASPKLEEKDVEAIKKGYEEKEKIIERSLLRNIRDPNNHFEEERLNIIAYLISNDILDIKIATFQGKKNELGLYHEKFGLIKDNYDNKIAFTGSLNESQAAFRYNFESIDVYCSWLSNESLERAEEKDLDFSNLWENKTKKLKVYNFSKAVENKLLSYRKPEVDWNIDNKEFGSSSLFEPIYEFPDYYPKIPDNINLYYYQKEAIDTWLDKNARGIFDMATGTGKTYAALGAAARLFEKTKKLAIIIVCPYQHLVEQWVEDVKAFNMSPVIGYSQSEHRNWKRKFKDEVFDYNLDVKKNICLITTNASFVDEKVQKQISNLKENILLIGDEAHNLGATNISKHLNSNIEFRLALSATIIRHNDEEGTEKILDYFGERCIEFNLKEAIDEGFLSKYYYYPVLVNLTADELKEYRRLSKQISKYIMTGKKGKTKISETGKHLAIKRARLVAGAINKISALEKLFVEKEYKSKNHILIYCGATTVEDIDYKHKVLKPIERRQIDAVSNLLGNKLGMRVSQFTSREDSHQRAMIKKEFRKGSNIQAIIAIRCLDEGIDIPKIRTAFILASSTNPKEYIQRRGRVLRLAEKKKFAEIYDFVTLPRSLKNVINFPIEERRKDLSLLRREMDRVEDFAEISENPQDGLKLISKIKDVYKLKELWG